MNQRGWKVFAPCLLVCVMLARGDGWNETAWARDNSFRNTSAWWATSHALVMTQQLGTNQSIFTNRFFANISPTNFTPDPITNTFKFQIADFGTNGVASNRAYTVTDIQSLTRTNFLQNWRAQIKWDCIQATAERMAGAGLDTNTSAGVRFYQNDKEQLVYLKEQLATPNIYWVSPIAVSNATATTNLSNSSIIQWTLSTTSSAVDLKSFARIGTNFFTYTPTADLFFTNSYYSRVMTCRYYIATSKTNTITQTVANCSGIGTTNLIGTNGQQFVFVSTNTYIDPSRNASDYGYYAFRRVLTNYSARIAYGSGSEFLLNTGTFANGSADYATAISRAVSDYQTNATEISTFFNYNFANAGEQIDDYTGVGGSNVYTSFAGMIGGTNRWGFGGTLASASMELFAGGGYNGYLLYPQATQYYETFGLGISNVTAPYAVSWRTLTITGWPGGLTVTTRLDAASFKPAELISIQTNGGVITTKSGANNGFEWQTLHAIYWFYGVPTSTPSAFKFR